MEPQKYRKLFRPRHLTIDDIKSGCITLYGESNEETQLCVMQEEFRQGIETIESYNHAVTFYGSARFTEDNPSYKKARSIANRIASELDYAVISGGGGGIMEAANRGAYEAGGKSIGLTIKLPHEQITNKYLTEEIPFYFFFTRKITMSYTTGVCLFFPGGFGTLDELFEMMTLKQTGKISPIPIILVGTEFWKPLETLVKENLVEKYKTVSESELNVYIMTDDEDEIIRIIKESKRTKNENSLQ